MAETLPKTFESNETDGEKIAACIEQIRTTITDPATGWAAIQKAKSALLDSLAKSVYTLRSLHRRRIRTDEGFVYIADWQGASPEYIEAWSSKIKPLITEHTTTAPAEEGGMDADYNAFVAALNRRVRVMVQKRNASDLAFMESHGATRGRKKNGNESVAISLPAEAFTGTSDDAEDVFRPVEVPAAATKRGLAAQAEKVLNEAKLLSSMVDEAIESGDALDDIEKTRTMSYAAQAAAVLAKSAGDEGSFVGVVYRVRDGLKTTTQAPSVEAVTTA